VSIANSSATNQKYWLRILTLLLTSSVVPSSALNDHFYRIARNPHGPYPSSDAVSLRYHLSAFIYSCVYCQALHWREERSDSNCREDVYSICCHKGDVSFELPKEPSEPLSTFLSHPQTAGTHT
jgi:hypothetical protein